MTKKAAPRKNSLKNRAKPSTASILLKMAVAGRLPRHMDTVTPPAMTSPERLTRASHRFLSVSRSSRMTAAAKAARVISGMKRARFNARSLT
jgi:hypothetical protein